MTKDNLVNFAKFVKQHLQLSGIYECQHSVYKHHSRFSLPNAKLVRFCNGGAWVLNEEACWELSYQHLPRGSG